MVMATLLTLTVPQLCPATASNPIPHECELQENVTDLTSINKAAVVWNFLTLALFMLMYFIQWKREAYFIRFLDTDQSEPIDFIRQVVQPYPKIKLTMHRFNMFLFACSLACIVFSLINLVLSALVVSDYHAGTRTVTVFITNFMLSVSVRSGAS
jgi:hypothetical protein